MEHLYGNCRDCPSFRGNRTVEPLYKGHIGTMETVEVVFDSGVILCTNELVGDRTSVLYVVIVLISE